MIISGFLIGFIIGYILIAYQFSQTFKFPFSNLASNKNLFTMYKEATDKTAFVNSNEIINKNYSTLLNAREILH